MREGILEGKPGRKTDPEKGKNSSDRFALEGVPEV